MRKNKLNPDSVFDYGTEHNGKRLGDVPCQYLVWIYNNIPTGDNGISKELDRWLDDNIEDIERCAGMGSTLNSYFEK